MIVESLNIGLPKKENFYGKEIITGIRKQPVAGSLHLGKLGFENDGVGDLKHHGGDDKAVCVYSLDHYPYWEDALGIRLPVVAFGENLTVSSLHEDDICIGDIFQLGTAVVQVSQPRQPCRTLAARYGRDDLVKLVVDSGRTGFYFRVLEEGIAEKGAELIFKERDPRSVSVSFANHTYHHDRKNCAGIERVLAVPALSASWQKSFQELKEKCI
ncbi:MAG: 6-N-hydroxylaminopurine resistance protein [Nitrospirae bacterium]|nr:6-N-hydroxylaminopurine resistance protein [Nitrospirota bacterium]